MATNSELSATDLEFLERCVDLASEARKVGRLKLPV